MVIYLVGQHAIMSFDPKKSFSRPTQIRRLRYDRNVEKRAQISSALIWFLQSPLSPFWMPRHSMNIRRECRRKIAHVSADEESNPFREEIILNMSCKFLDPENYPREVVFRPFDGVQLMPCFLFWKTWLANYIEIRRAELVIDIDIEASTKIF